jgi:conjugative transfer region protein TrbK
MSASDARLSPTPERWQNTVGGLQDAMRVQAGVVGNIDTNRTQMSALVGASQSATGALQATQAGNQLLALQAQQLADLTALVAANGRAQALNRPSGRRRRTGPRTAPPLPDAGHRLPARQRADVPRATEARHGRQDARAHLGASFVAVAITATAIEMTRKDDPQAPRRRRAVQTGSARAELARCSAGRGRPRDPSCLRAWAENRAASSVRRPPPAPAGPRARRARRCASRPRRARHSGGARAEVR